MLHDSGFNSLERTNYSHSVGITTLVDCKNVGLQKQFSRNIILLLLINGLIKPLYLFGIDAQVQNEIGHESYGVYFALFNFCFLLQIVLDLGLQNYNTTYLSKNRKEAPNVFPYVFGTKLILSAIFFGLVYGAYLLLRYPAHYQVILFGVASFMILQSFYVYLRSHFSALGYFTTDAVLSGIDKLLMILILGYFLYLKREINIHLFILGQLIALALANLIAFFYLRTKFNLTLKFSLGKSKTLIQQSLGFALVFLLMSLYTRMDGVMLERLVDDSGRASGLYASGYRLLDAANILGYLFASLLLPMFANLLSENKAVNPLIKAAMSLMLPLISSIAFVGWFYSEEILSLIYRQVEHQNITAFKYLMASFWFMSIAYIFGSLITASAKLKVFNSIFVVGIIINWVLNLLWIPQSQAIGAAQATLITQAVVCLGQVLLAHKRFQLKIASSMFFKVVIIVIITFILCYYLSRVSEMNWIIEVMIIAVFVILASFLSGVLRLFKAEFS